MEKSYAFSSQVLSGLVENVLCFSVDISVFSDNSLFRFNSSHYWECLAESYFMKGSYISALRAFTKAVEVSFFRNVFS